jgi:hypothetical protein
MYMNPPHHYFFNDISEAATQPFIDALEPAYYLHQVPTITSDNWWKVPCTYVICEKDNAIPVPMQETVSAGMQTVRLDLGHSPFCGHPEQVVDVLVKIMGE